MKQIETDLLIDAMSELHIASKIDFAKKERQRKIKYIKDNFCLKTLKQAGFLENTKDFDYIEKRICRFFGLESIYHYSTVGVGAKGIMCFRDGTAEYFNVGLKED